MPSLTLSESDPFCHTHNCSVPISDICNCQQKAILNLLFLIRKCIEQISIFTLFATLEEGFFNDPKVHQRFIRKVATTKKGLSHKKLLYCLVLTTFLLIEKEIAFHGSFDGLLSCPTVTLVDIPKEARIQKF